MSSFTSLFANISLKMVLFSVLGIAVAGWATYSFWPHPEQLNTETIQRGEFIQQVNASGKVTPSQEVELGFTQSGRITSVSARVGDRVGAGTVLARIDSTDLAANLLQRQAALESQEARLASLKQGTRPEEIAVAESNVESARSSLARANATVLDAVRTAYTTSDSVVRNDVYQLISNPRGTNPQLNVTTTNSQAAIDFLADATSADTLLTTWQADIDVTADADTNAIAQRAQTNLAKVSTLLSRASMVLNDAQPSQSVTATTISGYVTDISQARTAINTAISTLTSAVTSQRNAANTLDSAERTLALKKAGTVQSDIDAQQALVRAAEADVENIRSQIAKTALVAPFSGTVTTMDAKTGAIASPNVPLVSMISSGAYQIDSYIPEINIALVKVGDTATVTLDAYGEEVTFHATVVSIDPAETIRDGVPTYRAVLQFVETDERIRSGMTANMVITTEVRQGVLSVPQGVIIQRDGKKYVRIAEGEAAVEREVTTGALSSMGRIEVLSGLSEGDRIVLTLGE